MSRSPSVLVVDDDPATRRLLKGLLKPMGCRVRTASSGRGAMAELGKTSFDAVTLDFRLPDTTGDRLIPHIRAKAPGIAVLLISGHSRNEIGLPEAGGAVGFLGKPFSEEEFTTAFRLALVGGRPERCQR